MRNEGLAAEMSGGAEWSEANSSSLISPSSLSAASCADVAIVILNWNGGHFLRRFLPGVIAHAEGALTMLAEGDFNVLFTDVSLPGMSGVELARRARALYPALRVIFASGYGDALLRQIEFPYLSLQKPYEIEQLQKALADVAAIA